MKLPCVIVLIAGSAIVPAASPLMGAAGPWPYPGLQTESPLKLLDIIARPKYTGLEISPDGKYFAGVAMTEEGKTMLHILDRQTMAVVHSEVYGGPLGVGGVSWQDKDNLLIDAT